ncbi:MAG: hypothetical protein HUU43_13790 [Ignavibacteriaceae bacterium]|nr:hypothetical protein [Ignavibacteriaceae bacterium]NUM71916.1 hypothetical protein [Ignavibacteriaceae bacterium]
MITVDLYPFDPCSFLQMTALVNIFSGTIEINYFLRGETDKVLLPQSAAEPQRKMNLWDKTCFEFFMAPSDMPHYWEFNFSPSGDWNCFRLENYRKDASFPEIEVPVMHLETRQGLIFFQALLNIPEITESAESWDIQIPAVIQLQDKSLRFWSNSHFCDEPDFHSRKNFINQIKKSDF